MPAQKTNRLSKEAQRLRELLGLDYEAIAIAFLDNPIKQEDKKIRACRAILDAGKGETLQIDSKNCLCFGASWHLGFRRVTDKRILGMIRKFVVEGEKLFCDYAALDNIIKEMGQGADNSSRYLAIAPLAQADFVPQVIAFVCNPEAACRILTLAQFKDGCMPKIKIGGPSCRLGILYPILANEINVSFYDYTSRKMAGLPADKLIVSIPFSRLSSIMDAIDRCSAGTDKVEFPAEFRQFLQANLTSK